MPHKEAAKPKRPLGLALLSVLLLILALRAVGWIIIGGILVMEALSVILQTGYFKYTRNRYGSGRRIFRMAPIHHHFEQLGGPEAKVVILFWIIQILLELISLTTFKIR